MTPAGGETRLQANPAAFMAALPLAVNPVACVKAAVVVLISGVPSAMLIAGQLTATLRVVEPVQPFASVAMMVKLVEAAPAVGVP